VKLFLLQKENLTALAFAFNRGHAIKMLAKDLEARGLSLNKDDPVHEVDSETKRGKIIIYEQSK
jgi:hypothetical protein